MTERTGLYVLVFIGTVAACKSCDRAIEIKDQNNRLNDRVSAIETAVKPAFHDEKGNKYYEFNGQRAYVELNGRPAQTYLTNSVTLENK